MTVPMRFELEPRKRSAYVVACEMISIYGAKSTSFPVSRFDVTASEARSIWQIALKDMRGKSKVNSIYNV